MQQQLPRPHRIVIHHIALRVRRDVHILQPRLMPVDAHETIAQVGPPPPDRLYFGPGKHDPRLQLLVDEVVVVGAPVDRDIPRLLILLRHRRAPAWPAPASCPAPGPRRGRTGRPPRGLSAPSRDPAWSAG